MDCSNSALVSAINRAAKSFRSLAVMVRLIAGAHSPILECSFRLLILIVSNPVSFLNAVSLQPFVQLQSVEVNHLPVGLIVRYRPTVDKLIEVGL